MAKITLLFRRGNNGQEALRSFPVSGNNVSFNYHQVGWPSRWKVEIDFDGDIPTKDQLEWVQQHRQELVGVTGIES